MGSLPIHPVASITSEEVIIMDSRFGWKLIEDDFLIHRPNPPVALQTTAERFLLSIQSKPVQDFRDLLLGFVRTHIIAVCDDLLVK